MATPATKIKLSVKPRPKTFPRASVKPESQNGSFSDVPQWNPTGQNLSSSSDSKPAGTSPFPESKWKRGDPESEFEKVQTKEHAAKQAVSMMNQFLATLKRHSDANTSAIPRMEKLNAVLARRKEDLRVKIGFLGTTGAGKTTIVNALLGYKDLLPCTSGRAGTAVVVEVSWNKSADEDSKFRAEITYITREEWRVELEQIFRDLKEGPAEDDDDDEGPDTERTRRVNQTFDKIKSVYPNLKTLDDLKAVSVQQLLDDSNVVGNLGVTKRIAKRLCRDFSTAIRSYVDSGNHNSKASAQWPLVKLVKVYTTSSILANGITLVDLPGNCDTNAARSAMAAGYLQNLSVTCIVGNVNRGIDERNAHELLEKITKRNLQLDGLYNPESLCFILSQNDNGDLKTNAHLAANPALQKACAADMKQQATDNASIDELTKEQKLAKKDYTASKKKAKALEKELKALKKDAVYHPHDNARGRKRKADGKFVPQPSFNSKEQVELRKKIAELEERFSEARDISEADEDKFDTLARRIKHFEVARFHARSRVVKECLKHREKLSAQAIRKDHSRTLQDMGRDDKSVLQVFCVAAALFLDYRMLKDQQRQVAGFPTHNDTGIPALREFLISTTLKARGENAREFLEDVEEFVVWMLPWVNDKYGDFKMSAETRVQWETDISVKVKQLQQDLAHLSKTTTDKMKDLVQKDLYTELKKAEVAAASKAPETVKNFGKMHWGTHKCANRSNGDWTDSNKNSHKWNDNLVHDFTSVFLKQWDLTFTRLLPQVLSTHIEGAKMIVRNFAISSAENPPCTGLEDALWVLKEYILRTEKLLKDQTEWAFAEVKKSMQLSHRRAVGAVKTYLAPMYAECTMNKGRGHYKRNKDLHKAQMKNNGKAMHHQGSLAIQTNLNKYLNGLPSTFELGYSPVIGRIEDQIIQFFDQNSSTGTRQTSTRRVVSNAKVLLQEDLLADIDKLVELWKSNAPAQSEPEVEEPQDEFGLDDDRFFDIGENDDKDYEFEDDDD